MTEADFAERLSTIRARFAAKLNGKIEKADAALPYLSGDGSDAADAVATAYRLFHDICGIGATIGFERTGRAASRIDAVLIGPFRARRGLSADELTKLTKRLACLRIVARAECTQRTHSRS
jgi:hypothetical protein